MMLCRMLLILVSVWKLKYRPIVYQLSRLLYSWCRGLFYKRDVDITLRVSDCEGLVGPPDRRDSKPRSPMQAEIRLTTLCIERWGASALLPLPSVLTTLASQSVKYITAHLRTG